MIIINQLLFILISDEPLLLWTFQMLPLSSPYLGSKNNRKVNEVDREKMKACIIVSEASLWARLSYRRRRLVGWSVCLNFVKKQEIYTSMLLSEHFTIVCTTFSQPLRNYLYNILLNYVKDKFESYPTCKFWKNRQAQFLDLTVIAF